METALTLALAFLVAALAWAWRNQAADLREAREEQERAAELAARCIAEREGGPIPSPQEKSR